MALADYEKCAQCNCKLFYGNAQYEKLVYCGDCWDKREAKLKAADELANAASRYMFHVIRAPKAYIDAELQAALAAYEKARGK